VVLGATVVSRRNSRNSNQCNRCIRKRRVLRGMRKCQHERWSTYQYFPLKVIIAGILLFGYEGLGTVMGVCSSLFSVVFEFVIGSSSVFGLHWLQNLFWVSGMHCVEYPLPTDHFYTDKRIFFEMYIYVSLSKAI